MFEKQDLLFKDEKEERGPYIKLIRVEFQQGIIADQSTVGV